MKVTNYIASAALAATLGLWGASADALIVTFGSSSTSTNTPSIPVSGEALFSFASDTSFGGDLRIDVTVTNTTATSSDITQSFLTGFGFDILGEFKGSVAGTKLDTVNENTQFPGKTSVDVGACTGTSCTGSGKPDGIAQDGGSDSFSIYTLTKDATTLANAEQDYFNLFADGQPFSTGNNSDPTSVMRWRGIEGNKAGTGSETKINPTVVPLPAAAWLMITVFGGLGVAARCNKQLSAA